jgi:hypothetical protein
MRMFSLVLAGMNDSECVSPEMLRAVVAAAVAALGLA